VLGERVYFDDSEIIDKEDLPDDLPEDKIFLDKALKLMKTDEYCCVCWDNYKLKTDGGGYVVTFTLKGAKVSYWGLSNFYVDDLLFNY